MGAEGQGGGPRHQVEDPHQGAALHPLLKDVSTLLDRESENHAHWLHPQQTEFFSFCRHKDVLLL